MSEKQEELSFTIPTDSIYILFSFCDVPFPQILEPLGDFPKHPTNEPTARLYLSSSLPSFLPRQPQTTQNKTTPFTDLQASLFPLNRTPISQNPMALARLALKHLQQKIASASASSSSLVESRVLGGALQKEGVRGFASEKGKSEGTEVAVSEGKRPRSRLFPRRNRRKWLWRNHDRDTFPPALNEFLPSGLGNALMQATDNINRLFENMNLTPWSLGGEVREKDDHYKLRYEMPGIPKEDVKITIDDGVLRIRGEHRDEREEEEEDEFWASSSYGYYNTSLVLPEDAKADEVKAELKDGVLTVTIPRSEKAKKDVKQITVD